MKTEIKNYRRLAATGDGIPFSCTLYINGVKAALVADAAHGGDFEWHWLNKAAKATWDAYVKALPPFDSSVPSLPPLTHDDDTAFGVILEKYEQEAQAKKLCAKNVAFTLNGKPKEIYTVAGAYTQKRKDAIIAQHGAEKIGEFLNDRFGGVVAEDPRAEKAAEEERTNKWLKRKCNKAIVYRLKDTKPGSWMISPGLNTESRREAIAKKAGGMKNIVEWANDRFGQPIPSVK